jgi:myo-inositol 2-dehydrogenase / D-chiro-inositol 1-dehydrogenase
MINVCLFGVGRMGQDHAHHIQMDRDAKLYCVVDPNIALTKTVAEKYGAIAYHSTEEALSDPNVDAVVIASKTDTHAELIMDSARAGKPIFCEKPIDLSLEKTDECLSIVEKYGVPLLVGFNRRFDPSYQSLRKRVVEGDIGAIESLTITNRDATMPSLSFLRTSGGLFKDMMVHDFDMARWILQEEPIEVYATGGCVIDKRLEEFGDLDTGMAILKMESGVLCHINTCRRCIYGYDQRIEAFGSQGLLRANNLAPTTVEYATSSGVSKDKPFPGFQQRFAQAYQNEMHHFLSDLVKGKYTPLVSLIDARQALVIAEAAQLSFENNEAISIPRPLSKKVETEPAALLLN